MNVTVNLTDAFAAISEIGGDTEKVFAISSFPILTPGNWTYSFQTQVIFK
jgi:hypothetical protein